MKERILIFIIIFLWYRLSNTSLERAAIIIFSGFALLSLTIDYINKKGD